ncbi:MAG: hypothetical protein J0I29_11710 [Rhizobiales bacterium]|nr:hypothetical protein [Hyphomicrobiales bacterium]
MKLAGGQSGLTCAWTVEEGSGSAYVGASDSPSLSAPCDRAVRLRVPFEKKVAVKVSPGGGAPVAEYVKVHDILSVSIGDSFTSGEGNPDVPAKMKWTSTDQDPVTSGGYSSAIPGYIPLRKRDGDYFAAQWIDRACHRSAYSYPIRSAIQLALNHPHRAVTFLGYGCSGAEINEGLFGAYQGPEKTSKQDMPNYKKAQLSLMLNELCVSQPATDVDEKLEEWEEDARIKNGRYRFGNDEADAVSDAAFKCPAGKGFKRPVDVLSLGIGGNDVGFAKWIAASITKYNGGMDLAFLPIMKDDPDCNATNRTSCDVTEGRWRRFKARLALLRKFLSERVVYRVPEQQPVVVFTYPDTVADTTTTCKTGNAGMTVADLEMICLWDEQKQGSREINALGKIGYFVKNKLNTEIASFAKAAPPEKQWKLATDADDFIGDFKGRNFCATLNTPAEPSSACNDLQKNRELQMSASVLDTQKAIDETLLIPRKSGEVWKPFDPAINFSPYHHRHRWLRTVNDVYMLINQQPAQTRQSIDVTLLGLAQPALHGAFHPTAQAHARVADSFATSAETVIQKPQ